MSFDLEEMLRSKEALRRRLTALPIAEKLRVLDTLRARAIAIRPPRRVEPFAAREDPADYEKG